ncbi:MAG: hypothetical protein WCV69_02205 [Patescibacteria group bacterium]|jgi:hypothetical protein
MDINSLKLEEFNSVGSKFSRKISITNAASFGFTTAFIAENGLSDPQFASLFYDKNQNVIGIQFGKEWKEKNSLKLSFNKIANNASFGARSFFHAHQIKIEDIRGKYEYKKTSLPNIGEVYLIDLNTNKEIA